MPKSPKSAQTAPAVVPKKTEPRPLSRVQQEIAEEFSMFLHLGPSFWADETAQSVARVLLVMLGQLRERRMRHMWSDSIEKWGEERGAKWLELIEADWVIRRNEDDSDVEPAMSAIKRTFRSRLEAEFSDFLNRAEIGNWWLLYETLSTFHNNAFDPEFGLAEAFAVEVRQVNYGRCLVIVEPKHRDAVEAYARALEQQEVAA